MHAVVIRERDDVLNIIGPFWEEAAARDFVMRKLPVDSANWAIVELTDRDKFGD